MKVLNFILFQLGWFACVLGAGEGAFWLGPVAAMLILSLHLATVARPGAELWMILVLTLLGCLVDTVQTAFGVLVFPLPEDGDPAAALAGTRLGLLPPWLIALWALFAATFNSSMTWMRGRPWIAFALGAIGGPVAFFGGARLGALELHDNVFIAAVSIGIAWGVLTPALVWLASRLCQAPPTARNAP